MSIETNSQKGPSIECPNCHQSDKTVSASSAQIAAPNRPSAFARNLLKILFWTLAVVWGVVFLCNLTIMILGSISSTQNSDSLLLGYLSLVYPQSILLSCILCLPIVPILTLFFVYRHIDRNYQIKIKAWKRAMEKYNHLSYCSRCAGVFVEGQNRIIPIEQMQAFLYEIQDQNLSMQGLVQ